MIILSANSYKSTTELYKMVNTLSLRTAVGSWVEEILHECDMQLL